jgi:cell division protein FtsZ
MNALVVAVVTTPFNFEGKPRMNLANLGLSRLKEEVDSLIVIPNQKILELINEETTKTQAFEFANKVLYNATRGISQIITKTGEINVDFADVRTIMKDMGDAMIGTGIADGDNRAEKAALDALLNPLLDNVDICGSKCVLVNIASNGAIKMSEIERINEIIKDKAGEQSTYIFGIVDDKEMKDEIMVTVIATGFREEVIEIKEEAEESLNVRQVGKISSIPTTQEELSELDKPAFRRRLANISINDDMSEEYVAKKDDSLEKFGFDDFNLEEKEYTKPAFLRRQMD